MSDYDYIMKAIMAGGLSALEEVAQIVDGFPAGKDDRLARHWITNGIDCGTPEVVAWMLARGAPVIFPDEGQGRRDAEGYTVLHSALERRASDKYEIMRLLIEAGADVNAHGVNDWTPAHLAAARNDVEALKILRDAHADFNIRTRIDQHESPLDEARALGALEAVRFLEERVRRS